MILLCVSAAMKTYAHFLYILLFASPFNLLWSQNTISGIITEHEYNTPVEFAQIALMTQDSSLIAGAVSDLEGHFSIQTQAEGAMLLRTSFVGYAENWQAISVQKGVNRVGTIALSACSVRLDEIQVSAAATLFRSEADRRVYNVENMTTADGGTAIQLLETLPSVQVDEEGNLSMRGSGNILIYINGRPTNLLSDDTENILEQYPANAIQEVELITNPSARYDAEGIGGIINIILKESRKQGLNGQVNVSAGTGHKYNGGFNLNYRNNRSHIASGYSYRYRELWEETHSYRKRYQSGVSPILDHDYRNRNYTQGHNLRNSFEYALSDMSHLRLFANINYSSRERQRTYRIRSMRNANQLDSLYVRYLDEDQNRINYETGAAYNWRNNGKSLNFMTSYAFSEQERIEYFDQLYYDAHLNMIPAKRADQTYERPITNQLWLFQLDYEQALFNGHVMESGLKTTWRLDEREQVFNEYNFDSNKYIEDDWVTNQFSHEEQIHAAYLILRGQSRNWQYQGGLRAEYTLTESHQGHIDSTYIYNYFRLFPSMFVNYSLGQNQDLQFSIAQRIRRPSVTALQPFINAQDFFNLRLGNPYLEPERTLNTEINYLKSWEHYMLTAGVFNRYTTHGLARVFILLDDATMVTWTNANTHNATGLELINYVTLNDNFDAIFTANVYHAEVSGSGEGGAYSDQSYSWSLSLLSNFNLPGWFSTQVTAGYQGPQVIPNGVIQPVFSMNIGLRRNVLDGRGTLSFNLTDVFNSRHFSLETDSQNFYQLREFNRESQIATLSFTYRFQGYTERSTETREPGFERDMEGLY